MLESIRNEPIKSFIIFIMLIIIGFLIYGISQREMIRQVQVEHVIDHCVKTELVIIEEGFVQPVYDCSGFKYE